MSRVGLRLHWLASTFCSATTMERLVEPVLADLRYEHEQAVACGKRWRSCYVRAVGYLGFWKALMLHAAVTTPRACLHHAGAEGWLIVRLALMATVVFLAVTVLLILPPLLGMPASGLSVGLLAVYLAPQGMVLGIPIALSLAIAYGCRGRWPSRAILAAVLAMAIGGTAAALATREWLVPAANQGFRETVAARHGIDIRGLRGPAELSLAELGTQVDRLRLEGSVTQAAKLSRIYQLHWALCFASLALGIFSLGASTLSTRRSVAVLVGLIVPLGYCQGLWMMDAVLLEKGVHPAVFWLPNAFFIACGVALLAVRRSQRISIVDGRP